MKPTIYLLAAAIVAAFLLSPAQAAWMQPPAQYDRAFGGKVYIVQHDFWGIVRQCGWTIGCAAIGGERPGVCTIHIARVGTYMPGFSPARQSQLIRHERGHCNGWPGNHPGGTWRQ